MKQITLWSTSKQDIYQDFHEFNEKPNGFSSKIRRLTMHISSALLYSINPKYLKSYEQNEINDLFVKFGFYKYNDYFTPDKINLIPEIEIEDLMNTYRYTKGNLADYIIINFNYELFLLFLQKVKLNKKVVDYCKNRINRKPIKIVDKCKKKQYLNNINIL